jgi:ABC-type transport system involved in cytochrome c biogenesis permease subunit
VSLIDSSVFWLRAAAALYGVGLLHALELALGRSTRLSRPAAAAFSLGAILHCVSIVERGIAVGHLPVANVFESLSLCGLLVALAYRAVENRYSFPGLAVTLFPVVFLMTLAGSLEFQVSPWSDPRVRNAWLVVHVALILLGYAALMLTAIASVSYLVQERHLKQKRVRAGAGRAAAFLPPLGTLDELISSSMGFGFAFLTLGLVAGITWGFVESGTRWLADAKIALSLVTWVLCLTMLFLRTSAGWRGRKAAVMALSVLCCSAVTWAAHVGLRPALER